MRCLTFAVAVLLAVPVAAQIESRPTDPPIVTAENDSWYRLREPLLFAGDAYYPAGPVVFFNGNTMVRTGHYNGVPLYADTTIEPYSIVYVPVGRGLMQPYERLRQGDLAGTSGSRTPSFPARRGGEPRELPAAAAAPTALPQPIGAVGAFTAESGAVASTGRPAPASAVATGGAVAVQPSTEGGLATLRRAESNDGVWLRFMDATWISAGPAVPLRASDFVQVGEYAGFPVYARRGLDEDRIYLPTAADRVAPFRLK